MNNNHTRKAVLAGLALTLLVPAARAQTAIRELAAAVGTDAAPFVAAFSAVRETPQRPPLAIPLAGKDVLEGCAALDVRTFMAVNAKQGALLVQTCLNHAYPADGPVTVRAEAARFGVRACPQAVAGTFSCEAIREVDGIRIVVEGQLAMGNPVMVDLGFSLKKRDGKLLGLDAVVENRAQALR